MKVATTPAVRLAALLAGETRIYKSSRQSRIWKKARGCQRSCCAPWCL